MMFQDLIEDHKFELGCAAVVAVILVTQHSKISAFMATSEQQRQTYQAETAQVAAEEAKELARKQAEPMAIERYETGCELVYNLTKDNTYTALSVGIPVIKGDHADYYRDNPTPLGQIPHSHVLPAGMVVCDVYGNTSILEASTEPMDNGLPVVDFISNTSDRSVVQTRIDQEPAAIRPTVGF